MTTVINRSIGMMDAAYFVGRAVVLDWLNSLCQLKLTKIEETANGAVACQVLDALFPDMVPMNRVNWGAKSDYEFVANYKVLQSVFDTLRIDRVIPVDRLIRARYQDNLEFMQWLRKFYEDNYSVTTEEYDAVGRRSKGKGVHLYPPAQGGTSARSKPSSRQRQPPPVQNRNTEKEMTDIFGRPKPTRSKPVESVSGEAAASIQRTSSSELEKKIADLERLCEEKTNEISELTSMADDYLHERDFYFDKLREVEFHLQNYSGQDRDVVRELLKILYATQDDVDGTMALAAAEAAMSENAQKIEGAGEVEISKEYEEKLQINPEACDIGAQSAEITTQLADSKPAMPDSKPAMPDSEAAMPDSEAKEVVYADEY